MINEIHFGDCREILRRMVAAGVKARTCITSPPYFGLRDYGHAGQLGLEATPEEYVANLVDVFRGVRDVLTKDGTLWLIIADSYVASSNSNHGRGKATPAINGRGDRQVSGGWENPPRRRRPIGMKPKDLIGIPWMVAFALRADGWYLRQEIIWNKPNPMPESVRDRCTKAHESIFLLSKSPRYYCDMKAIQEPAASSTMARLAQDIDGQTGSFRQPGRGDRPMKAVGSRRNSFARVTKSSEGAHGQKPQHREGRADVDYSETRNKRSVWTIATRPYKGAHFATFPPELIEPCGLSGSSPGDVILDPFMGSGTTAAVAIAHRRQFIGCELNPEYRPLQDQRIAAAHAAVQVAEQQAAEAKRFVQLDLLDVVDTTAEASA